MKILLIYPYFLEARVLTVEDVSAVPLGVYYVAAVLKDRNYDVEVLNWHDLSATPEKIKEVLVEKKPDVIGFSILHGNRWGGIDITRLARQIDSRVTIVFGGVGANFLWEHFLTHFGETDSMLKAFSLTRKYGIMARACFIYGCPQETWQTIDENIDLMDRIKHYPIFLNVRMSRKPSASQACVIRISAMKKKRRLFSIGLKRCNTLNGNSKSPYSQHDSNTIWR